MQRYNWANTFNTRDLGFTPTMDGKYIKPLRFIRSDALHTISDDVKDFLIKNNIKTVIDHQFTSFFEKHNKTVVLAYECISYYLA